MCVRSMLVTEQSDTAWGRVFNPVMTLVTFLRLQLKKKKREDFPKRLDK